MASGGCGGFGVFGRRETEKGGGEAYGATVNGRKSEKK
jgi:hypothetical protein